MTKAVKVTNNRNSAMPNSMKEGEPSLATIVRDRVSKRVGVVESIKVGGWRVVRYEDGESRLRRSGNLAYVERNANIPAALAAMKEDILARLKAKEDQAKARAALKKRQRPDAAARSGKKAAVSDEPEFLINEPSVGKVVQAKDTGEVGVVCQVKCSGWRVIRTEKSDEDIVKRPTQLCYAKPRVAALVSVESILRRYRCKPSKILPGVGDAFVLLRDDETWRRGLVSSVRRADDSSDFEVMLTLRFEDGGCADEKWPPLAERRLFEATSSRVPKCIAKPPQDLVGYATRLDGRCVSVVGFARRADRNAALLLVKFEDDDSVAEVDAARVRAAMLEAEQAHRVCPYANPATQVSIPACRASSADDDDDQLDN